ncbi:MAG: alpha/beta hydrolase [Pseudomonadota bacterium]|nr:alpha/beta hydrolase [Pseudomonadota bacterium]
MKQAITQLWAIGLALLLPFTALAQEQPAPLDENFEPIEAVHPVWEAFEPEFTPYVCPYHAQAPEYDPEEFRCGYVLVPEDRTNPESRLIKLSVLKIASTTDNPEQRAVIRLTGGPGGTSLSAGRIAAYQRADTKRFRDAADLIFFDQRGIGYSEAHFCRATPREFQFGVPTEEGGAIRIEALKKCVSEARAEGIAVDAYSTWQNALDVRDIRRALGYEQWTLFGVSYGTELGQAVLEVDEEGVRAAILDSVVPADPADSGGWSGIAYGFRSALTAISEICSADKACARDIGAMDERFVQAIAALDETPLIIDDLDHGSYLDGRIVLDGDLAGGAVFQALYIAQLYGDFPSLLRALETRDAVAMKAYVEVLGRPIDHNAGNGMELIANCRGSAVSSDEQIERMRLEEPVLSQWINTVSWGETCKQVYEVKPDPTVKRLSTEVPILVAAGTVDPITPPSFGQIILPGLPNAQYVEFPYTGHGALFSHSNGCGGDLWVQFVSDPTQPLDTACIAEIPAPVFLTKLLETKAPYQFARKLQAGNYPHLVLALAGALLISLVMFPMGWIARSIQGREVQNLALARPLAWLGGLVSLLGLVWAVMLILRTATQHAMALPLGVLPATGWAFWIGLLGFGLTAFALYRGLRSGGFGRAQIGSSIGLILTCLAALGLLIFVTSLGLGPI